MEYPQLPTFFVVGLLSVCMLTGTGCSGEERSPHAIADSTLVPLLSELHLARARQDIKADLPPAVRDSILQRYNADSASLARTLSYYIEHPKEYQQLYDEVAFQLQEQRRDTTDRPGASPAERRARQK